MAMGMQAQTGGANSIAIGFNARTYGTSDHQQSVNSIAVGISSRANGANSMAYGSMANANGANAIAFGANSSSNGPNTSASGTNARAIGFNAIADGTDALAEGRNVIAIGVGAKAIGYNTNVTAMGTDGYAEGTNAMALGTNSYAVGINVTAIGPCARACGLDTTAFGTKAIAYGDQALAVGAFSSAYGDYTSAFGPGATSRAFGSTAIGMNAVTTRPFEVSLGSAASPYSLPGLHPNGFIGDRYQKPGEKRFVTTDQNGTLGTTSYSPDEVVASIGAVGALSAAMGSVPVTTLLPDETVRCGVGTGTYGGQYAGSVGCAAKVANRLFFNGGVAMTATDTVNNGAMGRLGFSFGFGGAPKKAKQAELAAIPTMNMGGNSLFELGNGQGVTAEAADSDVLMAKRSEPDLIPAIQPQNSHDRNERDQSTQHRFEQLESEIARLRKEVEKNSSTQDRDDEYFIALEQLEKLKKEKEQLSKMLGSLRNQLNQQQKTIQLLLEKVELNAQR
jgi:hypothetical protein